MFSVRVGFRFGTTLSRFHEGIKAVNQAEAFRPDRILIEVGMPRLNGHEASRQIRTKEWGTNIHNVAFTGWGQDRDRELFRQSGWDFRFVKPVKPILPRDGACGLCQLKPGPLQTAVI